MGRLLVGVDQVPELVISSTAKRAHQTAVLAAEAGSWDCQVVTDQTLYGGGPSGVLQTVAKRGGGAQRVLIVGHEPTASVLVADLVGARVEMKTASVAGIGLLIDEWADIADATGWLDFLLHPRMFFGSSWDI